MLYSQFGTSLLCSTRYERCHVSFTLEIPSGNINKCKRNSFVETNNWDFGCHYWVSLFYCRFSFGGVEQMKRAAMSKNLVFTGLVAKSIPKMEETMKRKKIFSLH